MEYCLVRKARLKSLLLQELKLIDYEAAAGGIEWEDTDENKASLLDLIIDWNVYAKAFKEKYQMDPQDPEQLREFVFYNYSYRDIVQEVVNQDIDHNYDKIVQ